MAQFEDIIHSVLWVSQWCSPKARSHS